MNCKQVHKLLYAFADGQLDVRDSCDVLDHLKMCPDCVRLVDEHQSLRAAVRRNLESLPVPGALAARIRAEVGGAAASRGRDRRWRSLAPAALAAAACVLLAAREVHRFVQQPSPGGIGQPVDVVFSKDGPATRVAEVHNGCCGEGRGHHNPALPTVQSDVARAISAKYQDRLAMLAPNLRAYGFEFESANFCGVRDGEAGRGGHLIYYSPEQDKRFSFFGIPRWSGLDRPEFGDIREFDLRKYYVEQEIGPDLHVIAWHRDATSYVCCSPLGDDEMARMVNDVRLALSRPGGDAIFAMIAELGR